MELGAQTERQATGSSSYWVKRTCTPFRNHPNCFVGEHSGKRWDMVQMHSSIECLCLDHDAAGRFLRLISCSSIVLACPYILNAMSLFSLLLLLVPKVLSGWKMSIHHCSNKKKTMWVQNMSNDKTNIEDGICTKKKDKIQNDCECKNRN